MKGWFLILFIVASLVVSCDWAPNCCTNVDIHVSMWIHNTTGKNLFDSATTGFFNADDIRLFTLKDGKTVEQYDPMRDMPRNFRIETNPGNGEKFITIFPELDGKATRISTLVKWSASDSDTFDFEIHFDGNSATVVRVWYNGDLSFNQETNPYYDWDGQKCYRLLEIEKD